MSEWNDLDGRARALLDAARVVLEGPASSYEGGGARGAPDSRVPTASGAPTLELIAQRLQDAGRGEELLRAVQRAELDLWRVRYSRPRSERPTDPARVRERVLRDWVGSAPEEVADFEPVTVAQVARLRADMGREPLTGRPAEGPPTTNWRTAEERALRVQQIRAAHPHLSNRAIGMMVGVTHPTVRSDLSRGSAQG